MDDDVVWLVVAAAFLFAAFLLLQPEAPTRDVWSGSTTQPVIYNGGKP